MTHSPYPQTEKKADLGKNRHFFTAIIIPSKVKKLNLKDFNKHFVAGGRVCIPVLLPARPAHEHRNDIQSY